MSAFLLYSKPSSIDPLFTYLNIPNGSILPRERVDVVFQWDLGVLSSQETSIHVLNGSEGLNTAMEKRTMLELLKLHGVPVMEDKTDIKFSTIRRYFVPVFQQEELALYRSVGKKVWVNNLVKAGMNDTYEEIEMDRTQREIRRVLQYAVRSIYATGLDYGGVLFGVSLNGQIKVIDVTPTPKLNDKLASKFAKCFENYADNYKLKIREEVVLGADPEFVLRNKETGKMVLASQFFPKRGRVGCDQIWVRSDQTRKQLPLAELRPVPSKDPKQLAFNLYKTMLLAEKKINNPSIEWLAGGMPLQGYPIGGHIHFSNTTVNSSLLRVLDNYLTLPVMLLENKHSLSRRPKYGFLGDFRNQFHGGFEYRSLPSWLIAPKITKAVLALAKLLAESYPLLNKLPTLHPHVQKAFYEGDKNTIQKVVDDIWTDVEGLPDYYKYEKYISPFYERVLNLEEWDEFQDIRYAWRIPIHATKKVEK